MSTQAAAGDRYKTLAANTALISFGTLGSKLMVFFMVRFYTGYMSPADYGTADIITQTANLLVPLVSFGMAEAVFRFAAGRPSEGSSGCTMEELSKLFEDLGCAAAYNLDGGQSSVMVWNSGSMTVNSPANGGRPVSDIIYIPKE